MSETSYPVNEAFIREKWLPALRSGEYKQGKSFLRDEHDQFCCLGVACDVIANENLIEGVGWSNDSGTYGPVHEFGKLDDLYTLRGGTLPPLVVRFLGITGQGKLARPIPGKNGRGTFSSLAQLNDYGDLDFHELADVIEQALDQGLFPNLDDYPSLLEAELA